jgi:hypothetical protein
MSLMDRGWLMLTACNMGLIVLRVGSVGSPKFRSFERMQ